MPKKAIVTGGSSGIGKGIAQALAANGYDVAITYSSKKAEAEEVAEGIRRDYGRECYCFQASLEKSDVPAKFFAEAVEALGGLDLLVNNAGLTICDSIFEISDEIAVMRDGEMVQHMITSEVNEQQVIAAMVGRDVHDLFVKEEAPIGDVALEVKNLSTKNFIR